MYPPLKYIKSLNINIINAKIFLFLSADKIYMTSLSLGGAKML